MKKKTTRKRKMMPADVLKGIDFNLQQLMTIELSREERERNQREAITTTSGTCPSCGLRFSARTPNRIERIEFARGSISCIEIVLVCGNYAKPLHDVNACLEKKKTVGTFDHLCNIDTDLLWRE